MSLKVFLLLSLVAAAAASPAPAPAPVPDPAPTFGIGLFNPLSAINEVLHIGSNPIASILGSLFRTCIGSKHTARRLVNDIVSYKIKSLDNLIYWSLQVTLGFGDVVDASINALGNLIARICLVIFRIIFCFRGYGSSSICPASLNTQFGVQAVVAGDVQAMIRLYGLTDVKAQLQLSLNKCSKGKGLDGVHGSILGVYQVAFALGTKLDDYINGRYTFVNDDITYCLRKITILCGVIGNSRQRGSGLTFAKNFVPIANKYLTAAGCKSFGDWSDIQAQLALGDGDNAPWGTIDPNAQNENGVTINLGIGQQIGNIFKGVIGVTRLSVNLVEDLSKIVLNSFEDCITFGVKIVFGLGGLLDATISGLGSLLVRIVAGLLKIVLCFLGANKGYGVCRPGWNAQFNINYEVYSIEDTIRAYGMRNCSQQVEDYIAKYTGNKVVSSTENDSLTILLRSSLSLARVAEAGKWDKTILITIFTHLSYLFGAIGNSNARGVGTEACNRFIPAVSKWLNDEGYPGFAANEDQVIQLINGANGDYNYWSADVNNDVNTKSGFIFNTGVSGGIGGLLGRIFNGVRGFTSLASNIFAELVNYKINVLFDVFGLTIRLILGLGGAINTTIRGLGSLLIRIVAFIFKVGICFKGFPGDRSICNNAAWNARFGINGEANSADALYILYKMNGAQEEYNSCIRNYNGKGTGATTIIIKQSSILLGFVKGGHSSITKETTTSTILSVTTITGAIANANKRDSGKEIIQNLYPVCGPKLVESGYPDINVYINTTIVVIGNANGDTDKWTSTGNNNGGDNTGNNNGGDNTGNNNGGDNTGNNNGGDNTGNNNGGDNNGNTPAPNTPAPNTPAPKTPAPTTQAPETPAPTTQAPETPAPTTQAPKTPAPTTQVPTTQAPTTQAPTTQAPTTQAPTTQAPTTQAPTTPAPTTQAPETPAPTTQAPETPAPTTQAPDTPAPTDNSDSTTVAPTDNNTPAPTDNNTPAPTDNGDSTTQAPTDNNTPAPSDNNTPAPTGNNTPAPTGNNTPAPTGNNTPAPTGYNTPAPSGNNTPAPTGNNTPAPTGYNTPAPSGNITPAPTGNNTPAPTGYNTPAPSGNNTPAPTGYNTPAPAGNGNNNGGQTGGGVTVGGSVSIDFGGLIGEILKGYNGVGKLVSNILIEIINFKVTVFNDVIQLIIRVTLAIGGVIDSVCIGLGSLFARLIAVIFKIGICVNGFPGDRSICTAAFNAQFGINGDANTASDIIALYRLNNCQEVLAKIRQSIGNKATGSITIVFDRAAEVSGWISEKSITKQYFSTCFGHVFTVLGAITNSNSKGSGTQLIQKIVGPINKYIVNAGYPTFTVDVRTIDVTDNGQVNWKSGASINTEGTVVVKGDGLVTNVKDLFKNVKDKNNYKQNTVVAVLNLDIPRSLEDVFSFGIKVILALGNIIDIFIGQLGSFLIRIFGFLLRYIVCVLGGSRNSKSFVCQKAYFDSFSVTASDNSWAGLLASFKLKNAASDLDVITKSFKGGDSKKWAGSEASALAQASAFLGIFKKKTSIVEGDLTQVFRIVATLLGSFANSWSVDLGKKIVDNLVPVCNGYLTQNNYPELNNQLPKINSAIQDCNNDRAVWSQSTTTTVEYQN